jgi:hypothetical protein
LIVPRSLASGRAVGLWFATGNIFFLYNFSIISGSLVLGLYQPGHYSVLRSDGSETVASRFW